MRGACRASEGQGARGIGQGAWRQVQGAHFCPETGEGRPGLRLRSATETGDRKRGFDSAQQTGREMGIGASTPLSKRDGRWESAMEE